MNIIDKIRRYFFFKKLEKCESYSWGENLLYVRNPKDGRVWLVNKATCKARLISQLGFLLGFSDDEIDFETLDQLPHSQNAHSRRIDYAKINRWTNCKNGLIALSWMLYPDGRYFADEDGYGMEDNDELTVYCIMNDNLEVIRPWTVVPDVPALLEQMGKGEN